MTAVRGPPRRAHGRQAPADRREDLDLHTELGVDRFLGQVDLGGMPEENGAGLIQRFGDIVAPAIHHVTSN